MRCKKDAMRLAFALRLFCGAKFLLPALRAVRNPGVSLVYFRSILSRVLNTPVYRMFVAVSNEYLGSLFD
jgi:hypothetical protein